MGVTFLDAFPPVALPSILVHPEEVVGVFAGAIGSLVCVANGEPPPSISWFRNGMEIRNESFVSVTIVERVLNSNHNGSIQSIMEVCPFESGFSGNFSCQAFNGFGNQAVNFELLVASGIDISDLLILETVQTPNYLPNYASNTDGKMLVKCACRQQWQLGCA